MQWDVVIVGAGAAGLLAASRAAEGGLRTLLLEKNRKPGAKILMSGGTRCNITQATDARGIVDAFGRQGRFLHSALAALSPDDLVALFEAEGVATKREESGKIFPESDKAFDVLAALRRRLERAGAELALEEPLMDLVRDGEGFTLTTPQRTITTTNVLVTTGGKSYPGCGTTGDGYPWMKKLGHTIVPTRPALTPITTNVGWVAKLSGVTLADVEVRVMESPNADTHDGNKKSSRKNKPLSTARGGFLFTHFGLSGPTAMDVSGAITGHAEPQSLVLECDFLPGTRGADLDQELRKQFAADGKKQLATAVSRHLPKRLAEALLEDLSLLTVQGGQLSNADRRRIVEAMKETRIPISGTRGFKKAEVTAGGVALSEVDSKTMQSKLVPNLYLAGEILDFDGPIGGYNFQAAFSTAWLAATHLSSQSD